MAMATEKSEQPYLVHPSGILLPPCKASLPQGRLVPYRDLDVTYFTKANFLRNATYLKELYASFGQQEIGWSQKYARDLADIAFNLRDLTLGAPLNEKTIDLILGNPAQARKIPSVVLLSRPKSPGTYIGFSAQRMFYPVVEGPKRIRKEVPVLGHLLRIVAAKERDKEIGRFIPGFVLSLHDDVEYYLHRTGNFIAAYVNTKANYLDQEESAPWNKRYRASPYLYNLARETYSLMRGDGPDIDEMGVARRAYREPNAAVPTPLDVPEHKGSMKIWQIMFEEFGMGPLDGVVPIYRVANQALVRAA